MRAAPRKVGGQKEEKNVIEVSVGVEGGEGREGGVPCLSTLSLK